jgi:baseplate upper protein BppU
MAAIDVGPPKVDLLRIRAGDRNLFSIKLTQNDQPFDLTGLTIKAQARLTPVDTTIALTAVITVVDALEGHFEMRWPGDAVQTLLAGANEWSGVWDLEIDSASEDPQTLMAGVFTVEPDVTR